jgi:dihydropteroate synthase
LRLLRLVAAIVPIQVQLTARRHTIEFPRPALIMGIVNLCADSFSGDGLTDPALAVAHAERLVADGADIIDIGAESARTNRAAMSTAEEADRLCAFIARWQQSAAGATMLSINTWRSEVVRQVFPIGGDLLNDISALPTAENARVCAEQGAALLIMHSVGEPKIAHTHVRHGDIMETLDGFFAEKIALAESAGLPRTAIVLDPGIDFAKQREDNLRIYRELARLHRFERPILLPVSRKTVIGETLGIVQPDQRDAGTIACLVQGVLQGAQIFRVHNVRAAWQAARTVEAVG